MSIVKISWSGGKDSTAAALIHLERGDYCKIVCYVPFFDENTPLILKDHYEHILKTAEYFKSKGAQVWIVHGMTYVEFFFRRSGRGKYKGRMFCWPCFLTGKCNFKTYSKNKAIKTCDTGRFDYEDIGIAWDEIKRYGQLSDIKRSILVEKTISEEEAKQICIKHSLLSPHYATYSRDGCALCPHAKAELRQQWFSENPNTIEKILQMQKVASIERPGQFPLRNKKNFL